jgi:hypothetical protein
MSRLTIPARSVSNPVVQRPAALLGLNVANLDAAKVAPNVFANPVNNVAGTRIDRPDLRAAEAA